MKYGAKFKTSLLTRADAFVCPVVVIFTLLVIAKGSLGVGVELTAFTVAGTLHTGHAVIGRHKTIRTHAAEDILTGIHIAHLDKQEK